MLTYPQLDPVIVSLGPISIHWYGMMYMIGLGFGYYIATRDSRRPWSKVKREHLDDLLFYCAMGIIIGGRLGSAFFYNPDKLLTDPLWVFRIWEGGMAFHGGLLGVGVGCWLFARKIGATVGEVFDFVAPCAPIGLGLGRIGNFIGQELWGRPTDSWAGMIFPADPSQLARHPSQLYQATLEGLMLFAIVFWFSRQKRPPYSVTGVFLIFYSIFRFIIEFFRQPDAHIGFDVFGWMTRGQLLCIPMMLGGVALVVFAYQLDKRKNQQA